MCILTSCWQIMAALLLHLYMYFYFQSPGIGPLCMSKASTDMFTQCLALGTYVWSAPGPLFITLPWKHNRWIFTYSRIRIHLLNVPTRIEEYQVNVETYCLLRSDYRLCYLIYVLNSILRDVFQLIKGINSAVNCEITLFTRVRIFIWTRENLAAPQCLLYKRPQYWLVPGTNSSAIFISSIACFTIELQ